VLADMFSPRLVARRVAAPLLAAIIAGGSAFAAMAPDRSAAASTTHLTTIGLGYGDSIFNYDFSSQTADSTHVDWAVSLLFYNNASINKVKTILGSTYGACASTSIGCSAENARMNDGSGYSWDTDRGRKNTLAVCFGSSRHYRVYAPSAADHFYNPGFGYYVVGTTHRDNNELCGSYYDDSEGTERTASNSVAKVLLAKGYAVAQDYAWYANPESGTQGNHRWSNDGYATYVNVP
jgi:hypothetical protein